MIKLKNIINETESKWAFHLVSNDDWKILANLLEKHGWKFLSGYTFSGKKLSEFEPLENDPEMVPRDDDAKSIMTYLHYMSYTPPPGGDLIVLSMPSKKITLVGTKYFNSRKNSTYKNYTLYKNITDIINLL